MSKAPSPDASAHIERTRGAHDAASASRLARYVLNRAVTFPSFLAGSVMPTIVRRAAKREAQHDGATAPGTA